MPQHRYYPNFRRRIRFFNRSLWTFSIVSFIVLFWFQVGRSETVSSAFTESPLLSDNLATSLQVGLDTLWVIFAGSLVFFMNSGFAMLEAGFCRQQNTVNILTKNLIVFALSTLAFWAVGFSLMFSDGNGFLGLTGFFLWE